MSSQYQENAKIYAPIPGSSVENAIAPGSGIVGFDPDESGNVTLYYEGNLNIASNLHDLEDRIKCAAGRLFQRYPTIARGQFCAEDLIVIGQIDLNYQISMFNPSEFKRIAMQYGISKIPRPTETFPRKSFVMSKYASLADLNKDKADHYERIVEDLVKLAGNRQISDLAFRRFVMVRAPEFAGLPVDIGPSGLKVLTTNKEANKETDEQAASASNTKAFNTPAKSIVPTPFAPDGDLVDPFLAGDRVYFGKGPIEFIGHVVEEGEHSIGCEGVEVGRLSGEKTRVIIGDLVHLHRVDDDDEWQRLIQHEPAFADDVVSVDISPSA